MTEVFTKELKNPLITSIISIVLPVIFLLLVCKTSINLLLLGTPIISFIGLVIEALRIRGETIWLVPMGIFLVAQALVVVGGRRARGDAGGRVRVGRTEAGP